MRTILLLDFYNFVWKGSVNFKDDKKASHTIVFNFFRNLKSLVEKLYPSKIFICGEGGKTFRHALYGDYKSNRIVKAGEARNPKTIQNLYEQANIIWDMIQHLCLHRVFAPGFEADDVIATLAQDLKNDDTIIVSNDSDYTQLLQKDDMQNISIFNPFIHEYVVAPSYHYLTYKICAGDKADNIPGLVGNKKAVSLATSPKALASFIGASSNEVKENYNLNKSLIELKPLPLDKLVFIPYKCDYAVLRSAFIDFKFKSLIKDYETFTKAFSSLN